MTLMRDVIKIPPRVTDSDFVMRLSEGVAHARQTIKDYVVTDSLKKNFTQALDLVGQAVQTGRSQAAFLHGSFGAGKSHFMAMLHEILVGNPDARAKTELSEQIDAADAWLTGIRVLPLTFHMLGARSVEEAVFSGYRTQIARLRPDAPPPALHRSDALLENAAQYRADIGDDKFFERLSGGSAGGGSAGWGAYRGGWTAATYAAAAAAAPGTPERDRLVSDLTATLFSGAVHSGEYLDIDTGLAVLTQHAKSLEYDVVVLFLDELVLWLSQHLSNLEFVNQEGGKLAKFVESADAHRPVPLVSFVARQRDLAAFLGPHVPGAERQAFSDVFRHGRGRFQEIPLEERNLPLIAEKRLLEPKDNAAKKVLDDAFAGISRRPEVWDTLRLGAQFEDAGIGSDEAVFRRLYPFSPALVATLVALSQALQRERTALKTMLRLLVDRRDTLQVNDLIGVAELFDELVGKGELPDEPALRKHFETARTLYRTHLRPLLLRRNSLDETGAASAGDEHPFRIDDRLVKTLLLGALVPDVPALNNLTAAKLHALNYGSIASPLPGMEPQIVLGRLRELSTEAPEIRVGEGPDPVTSLELSDVDYQAILDRVPQTEDTPGARRRLLRELICGELGVKAIDSVTPELSHPREWRGRRHQIDLVFGNVRDKDELPEATLRPNGDTWRLVVDYPFDAAGHSRRDDLARVDYLHRSGMECRTVFWLPFYLTEDRLGGVSTLLKLNYVLAGGGDERLYALASDMSAPDRQQAKLLLEQQQRALRDRLLDCLKQAYGAAAAQAADVEFDSEPVFRSLDRGLRIDNLVGGTLKAAFDHLTGQMLTWSYPGQPNLPEDEPLVRPTDLRKVLEHVRRAVADETRGVVVEQNDRQTVRRICNPLRLGELVENKYVLNMTTSFWTPHLLRGAAGEGYTDRFPVRVLRELIEQPARGLDKPLQNLIIAAFALDQDLGWYQYEGKVAEPPLEHITDELELRHPPLPPEEAWQKAVRRLAGLFGLMLPPLRSVANVADLARQVREVARGQSGTNRELVRLLERHAQTLGLDLGAEEGRLATARRVATLLEELAQETDEVVLVELLASADLGVDDTTASRSMTTARPVGAALTRSNQWTLLDAIAGLTDDRAERARMVREQLADAATRDQFQRDLIAELDAAVKAASELLATTPTVTTTTGTSTTTATTSTTGSTMTGGTATVSTATGDATVADAAGLEREMAKISKAMADNPGKRVRVTWRVEP
ncbi:phage resistance protein [Phytohabitans kaempferiae]|uniref:Phage resistance protein n=1 Tax=Phytohabitans kaempferiae TaxID=1620943 RepID=A0ABV6MDY9_9ACTN